MNVIANPPSLPPLIQTHCKVIERSAIGVKAFATGSEYRYMLRREVKDLPKPCFLFAAFVFGPLAIFDVGDDAIPFDHVASFISQKHAPHQVPAIFPICASETQLVLIRLAAGNPREPLSVDSLKIIGVSYGMPT